MVNSLYQMRRYNPIHSTYAPHKENLAERRALRIIALDWFVSGLCATSMRIRCVLHDTDAVERRVHNPVVLHISRTLALLHQ